MTRRTRRTSLLAGLGAGAVLVLSACGGASAAGSAAILGDSSVTTEQVAAQVAAVHRANGEPVDQVDEELTRQTVERLTTEDLVNQAADRLGVTVDPGEIDARLALYDDQLGGREEVEKAFLQNGVPAEAVRDTVALSLKAEAMGPVLVPGGAAEEQQQAVYEYIVGLSEELGVSVSPRFGTWDATQLAVGPRPTDLAVPMFDALLDEGVDPGASEEPAASPSPAAS